MPITYKLNYFKIKGRAEFIRYIFLAAGQEFEDFGFTGDEWKSTFKAQSPLGTCPWLEVRDGQHVSVIGQSNTIARYLARQLGLAGKTPIEQAEAEMWADQVLDLKTSYQTMGYESDAARKAELTKKFSEVTEPFQFGLFERRLAQVGSGYLVASGLTFADLQLTLATELIVSADRREQFLAKYPHLKKLIETVNAIPAIAARNRA